MSNIFRRGGSSHKQLPIELPVARVVVGVDFGTTFSGFAFAHISNPGDVNKFLEWPDTRAAGVPAYCKTQTSLYYKYFDGEYVLAAWGWPAQVAYRDDVTAAARAAKNGRPMPTPNKFLTKFKLHLAGEDIIRNSGQVITSEAFPPGLTAEQVVTDYLREMKIHIMKILQLRYGGQLSINEVQWCLTVPAIWTDDAKLKMGVCSEKAGLVQGPYTPANDAGSPHPIQIVLEPEAAALACWKEPGYHLKIERGEHILVADIGGGTVDIVVHEKVCDDSNDRRLKEVVPSSGGLFGGTFVDQDYLNLLRTKIPCFNEHVNAQGRVLIQILKQWHDFKSTYDGAAKSRLYVELPSGLTAAWKQYDKEHGIKAKEDEDYEELLLTNADLQSVFDPTVSGIMKLIHAKMTNKVKVLMVVGGFSASPYLMARIQEELKDRVTIVNPNNPGAAICCGAVEWALNPRCRIVSRIAKMSYGVGVKKPFNKDVHPKSKRFKDDSKNYMCSDLWNIYVKKGEEVDVDSSKYFDYGLVKAKAKTAAILVYCSSKEPPPMFTDDEGVSLVGSFEMDVSDGVKLGVQRSIRVSMQFGQATIEVKGQRLNFGDSSRFNTSKFTFETSTHS